MYGDDVLVMTFCLRRLDTLSWEEFSAYWGDVHAPLVHSHAETLGIRAYKQIRTLQIPGLHRGLQARNHGSPEPYDGIAQVWLDDLDALRKPTTEAGRAAAAELLADEERFIDLPRSPIWVGEEGLIFGF